MPDTITLKELKKHASALFPRLELLRDAAAIIDGIPEDRIDLDNVYDNAQDDALRKDPNHCGTVGCALGWLSLHPGFQKATGLTPSEEGSTYELAYKGEQMDYPVAAAMVFGIQIYEAKALFGIADREHWEREMRLIGATDKDIFRERVKRFLKRKQYSQPASDSQG